MTFEVEWAALGQATAGLLLESTRVPASSVRTASKAQAELYALLDRVHRGLVGGRPAPTVSEPSLEKHPVGALGRILDNTTHARRPAASTLDALATPPSSRAHALWRDVLRRASLASVDWEARSSTPIADAAWSLIGDVAALSGAASRLDEDLVVALRAGGHAPEATTLRGRRTGHLRMASARTMNLAGAGPQPAVALTLATSRRPVLVATAASVAEGQRRLAGFLRCADDVTPRSVFVVAALTAQSALVAAGQHAQSDVAAVLREHAEGLALAARLVGDNATVRDGDDRPEAQAYELRRHLRAMSTDGDAVRSADAFARGLSDVVRALAGCASRQNAQGHWLVPAIRPGPAMWQRSSAHAAATPFVDRLVSVAAATGRDQRLPVPHPSPAALHALRLVPPRTSLGSAVHAAGRPLARPPTPAQPPAFGQRR